MSSASLVLTVLVSVAVLFSFTLIFSGVQRGVQTSLQRGGAQLVVIPKDAESLVSDADLLFTGAPATMYMASSLYEQVEAIEGVGQATSQFYSQTLDASCCSALSPTRLIGFDAPSDFLIRPLIEGQGILDGRLAADQVVLGSDVDGFDDGRGQVLGNEVTVVATLAPTGTELDSSILVDIDVARDISSRIEGYDHFWEKYGQPSGLISTILVNAQPGQEDRLARLLASLGDVKVLQRSQVIEHSQQQLQAVFAILLGAGLVMALASLLQLFARFYSMAWDRKSEFALYRALGATQGRLRLLVGVEALILTVIGVVVGSAIGWALYGALLRQLGTSGAFPYITPDAATIALVCLGLLLLFTLMATAAVVVPLRRIGRIDPSIAMQQMDIG